MTRLLHVDLTPGLPPNGAAGQFLGRDATGCVFVVRWMPKERCFAALGWEAVRGKPWPVLKLLRDVTASFIIGHIQGPPTDMDSGALARNGIEEAAGEGNGAPADDRRRVADRFLETDLPRPTTLPASLAVKPNIPHAQQTLEQLREERDHWDNQVRLADPVGAARTWALRCLKLCEDEIASRLRSAH